VPDPGAEEEGTWLLKVRIFAANFSNKAQPQLYQQLSGSCFREASAYNKSF